jgi:hypothetical protein
MSSKQRLADLEKRIETNYQKLAKFQERLDCAASIREQYDIESDIRKIRETIRDCQTEYWGLLAQEADTCKLAEVDVSNALVEVVPKVEQIVNKSSANYPDEFMQKLQEILDTLKEPQTPAAAKLIATLHLIPGILSCEMELGTEISLTSVFGGIKKLLKKNSPTRLPSSTHPTEIEPDSPQLIPPQASVVLSQLYQEIEKPGALIRVKTSRPSNTIHLIAKEIIKEHTPKDYKAVRVNFEGANHDLTNSDKLWQWFCAQITSELQLQNTLPESWQGKTSSNLKGTDYFEEHLLSKIQTDLVLVLYNVEFILEHRAIANDFFGWLRAWHQNIANKNSWKKLRLVIVHSKNIRTNPPLNLGVVIEFP